MSTSPRTTEFTRKPTDNAMSETVPSRPGPKIASVPAPLYVVLAGLVLTAAITGNLPDTMVVGFAATILLGGLFIWIGNLFPVVRDFGLPSDAPPRPFSFCC